MASQLSIIIPTFNEERGVEHTLVSVQVCAPNAEILVVDGGSTDETVALASRYAHVIVTQRGRGGQLNAGVMATQGDILLFLHADTLPENSGIAELLTIMQDESIDGGAFRMHFNDTRPVYHRICESITRRSLRTKSYTGDQAIFTRRSVFSKIRRLSGLAFHGGCRLQRTYGKGKACCATFLRG